MAPSLTFYRALLRLCPREFRRSYGEEAASTFAEALSRLHERREPAKTLTFALSAYFDIVLTALREHAAIVGGDVSFALRLMAKSWVSSAIVIATLALAIGIGATVFSAIDSVLLAPLPYENPSQLAFIFDRPYDDPAAHGSETSLPNTLDWPRLARSFRSIGSYANWMPTRTRVAIPQAVPGQVVTGDFFATLGVRPRLGRLLDESDARPGAPKTIVISEAYWRGALGATPNVLGETLSLSDVSYRIVGVLPHEFVMPRASSLGGAGSDVYRALADNASPRDSHYLITVARLHAGVSPQAAAADMDRVAALLRGRYPIANANLAQHVIPMSEQLFGAARLMLGIALAAVVGIVLIACLNVSNILLGRIADRERELSIRFAVGASRGRLIGQLFVESAVLAGMGGSAGLALCAVLVHVVPAFGFDLPRIVSVHVSPLVVLVTLGVTCACAIGIGTLPALTLASPRFSHWGGKLTRSVVVVLELSLALALVTGSALLVRSFIAISSIDVGFDYDGVVATSEVMLPLRRYSSPPSQLAFAHALLARLQSLPDLQSPGLMVSTPLSDENYNAENYRVVDRPVDRKQNQTVDYNAVTAGGLRSLRLHLLTGRLIGDGDNERTAPVAIVTRAFARKNFPNGSPIGRRIVIAYGANPPWGRTIVGIVDDFKMEALTAEPTPQVIVPFFQDVQPTFQIVARTRAANAQTAAEISQAIRSIDHELPPRHVASYATYIADRRSNASTAAQMLGFMAFVGLLLAGLGTYGVVTYTVGRRAREFGIRRALGAKGWTIASSVFVQVAALFAAGTLLGVLLSAAGAAAISTLLYRVSPFDPPTFAVVALALAITAFGAALVPAVRAMRIDPVVALRHE
jgi:putative ABC transport system permease protein